MTLYEILHSMLDPLTLLVLGVFLLITVYLFSGRSTARLPPGPKTWPIVGNLLQLIKEGKPPYEVGYNLRKQYGDIIRLQLGPSINLIMIHGNDKIHKLGMDPNFRFRPTSFFTTNYIFKQKGLLFGNGETHSLLRKFTLGALRDFGVGKKSLEETIQEEASRLCEYLEKQNGKPGFYFNLFKRVVSNVIASLVYGDRYEFGDPEHTRLLKNVDCLFRDLTAFMPENFFPLLRFVPGSQLMRVIRAMNDLEKYAKWRIAEHRSSFDPDSVRDFVDLYLKYEHEDSGNIALTEDNLFRVIVDLFNAGTETTATTLIWSVLHLVRNPDVQTKCRAEIMQVVGEDRCISLEDKKNMPYLQAFINEVLRFSTVGPVAAPHTCLEDTEFEGYIIPKNSLVVFNLYSNLMDPEIWTNPEEFRPERFMSADGKTFENHEAWIPFSTGTRACLGKHLALMENFIFIGTLIQKFEFKSPQGQPIPGKQRINTGISCRPKDYDVCAISLSN